MDQSGAHVETYAHVSSKNAPFAKHLEQTHWLACVDLWQKRFVRDRDWTGGQRGVRLARLKSLVLRDRDVSGFATSIPLTPSLRFTHILGEVLADCRVQGDVKQFFGLVKFVVLF
jgi:hypothetical protein